jgi:hypothetical protein
MPAEQIACVEDSHQYKRIMRFKSEPHYSRTTPIHENSSEEDRELYRAYIFLNKCFHHKKWDQLFKRAHDALMINCRWYKDSFRKNILLQINDTRLENYCKKIESGEIEFNDTENQFFRFISSPNILRRFFNKEIFKNLNTEQTRQVHILKSIQISNDSTKKTLFIEVEKKNQKNLSFLKTNFFKPLQNKNISQESYDILIEVSDTSFSIIPLIKYVIQNNKFPKENDTILFQGNVKSLGLSWKHLKALRTKPMMTIANLLISKSFRINIDCFYKFFKKRGNIEKDDITIIHGAAQKSPVGQLKKNTTKQFQVLQHKKSTNNKFQVIQREKSTTKKYAPEKATIELRKDNKRKCVDQDLDKKYPVLNQNVKRRKILKKTKINNKL